ncbi:hypothetical protein [Bradyrhizobium sp. Arg816]|uniref:hypothetical protein n=1 Tax=Bradyrhizobium sp. Arg816 TaxID=2998491 RepID=UPI00249F2932|nr:hypothetical protein [Bradyrhizobium sp. Arg816]MDI3562363.1 hypothetical protein [Bradyrhizobium sp. Arg816]
MGLDIYHLHIDDDVTDFPVIIDVEQAQLQKIVQFSRKKTNQYIDFERLLSDHGFSAQDYYQALHQRELSGIGKFSDSFYFCPTGESDPMNPTQTGLYFTDKRSFFAPKPQLPPNVLKRLKAFKIKQYPMVDRLEDVVYTKQIGYQRNAVADAFFNEFLPDGMFVEKSYAQRIFELTIAEAQQDFRTSFLDNWDDQRSLVVVSW